MFATDVLQVLYAPHKAFKKIAENPKYWGPLLILLLFVAAQSAFYYSYYQKSYGEQTFPAGDQFGTWTQNAALWMTSSGVTVSHSYADYINNSLYGNSSIQFDVANSGNLTLAISNFDVSCGPSNYQNLSLRAKIAQPQDTPQKVTLTLFSINNSDYFQYDLTPNFANTSAIGQWKNLTVPVGSGNWQSVGSPQWSNITCLQLDFIFPANSNLSVRMQGVFFRGLYETPIQVDSTTFLASILEVVFMRFFFEWLLLTGLMFLFIKGLKGNVSWKGIFICMGYALVVLVMQAVINAAATATLSTMYYPVEALANVPGEAAAAAIQATTASATFGSLASGIQVAMLVWLAALGAFAVRALLPEFTWSKAIITSSVSLILTIILLSFLGV